MFYDAEKKNAIEDVFERKSESNGTNHCAYNLITMLAIFFMCNRRIVSNAGTRKHHSTLWIHTMQLLK